MKTDDLLIQRFGRTIVEHYEPGTCSWKRHQQCVKSVEMTLESDGSVSIRASETPKGPGVSKTAYVTLSPDKALAFARAIVEQFSQK